MLKLKVRKGEGEGGGGGAGQEFHLERIIGQRRFIRIFLKWFLKGKKVMLMTLLVSAGCNYHT